MILRLTFVAIALTSFAQPGLSRDGGTAPARAASVDAVGERDVARPRRRRGGFRVSAASADRGLPPPKPTEFGGVAAEPAPIVSPFDVFSTSRTQTPGADQSPIPSTSWFGSLFGEVPAQPRGERLPPLAGRAQIDALVSHHARLNGVPEALVHRVIVRESKYNPRAVGSGGAMGLMQIKTATARGLGYGGGPMGLLDAETNLTYAVKYLAGAYRVAEGNHDQAVMNYARGYYYAAKRKGLIETAGRRGRRAPEAAPASAAEAPPSAPSMFTLFRRGPASAAAEDRSAR